MSGLSFEKPIVELEDKIQELREFEKKHASGDRKVNLSSEIKKLEAKVESLKKEIYENLTPWQRIQLSRHPRRPFTLDYIDMMSDEFIELRGDRCFADDKAIVAGLATIDNQKVLVMGHQKGRNTEENIYRNFGCAHPEGYRKAMRLMRLAERFSLPILIFVDTPGAYPGIGAEERGQAQAIAENLREMVTIKNTDCALCYRRRRQRWGAGYRNRRSSMRFGKCVLFCYFSRRLCGDTVEKQRQGKRSSSGA